MDVLPLRERVAFGDTRRLPPPVHRPAGRRPRRHGVCFWDNRAL